MTEELFLAMTGDSDVLESGPRLVYADWLEERGECDAAARLRVETANEWLHAQRWLYYRRRKFYIEQPRQINVDLRMYRLLVEEFDRLTDSLGSDLAVKWDSGAITFMRIPLRRYVKQFVA